MNTHLTDDDLVLHYYGELDAAGEIASAAHLNGCGNCHARFRRLQRVLAVVDETTVSGPELPESFERTVWARLEPNLERRPPGLWPWFVLSPARLALVASVAVLVGAAFLAGRIVPRDEARPTELTAAAGHDLRERVLFLNLDEHFDRTQMVLVELVNSASAEALTSERARAEQLVAANRLYRHTATATGDAAVTELLEELERVLVEVAAAPEDLTDRGLERLRRRIEEQGLLFKLRVVSSELRERQRPPAPPTAGRSSL